MVYRIQKKGALDEAVKQYSEIIRANPNHFPALSMLGMIYERQGKIEKAKETYKKALEINPKHAVAANNLARLYSEHGGNIDVVLSLAEIAKAQAPEDPRISDTLGWIYYKKKAYMKTISMFEESLEKMPDNPSVHYHLGMALYKKGDMARAKEELETFLNAEIDDSEAKNAKKVLEEIEELIKKEKVPKVS